MIRERRNRKNSGRLGQQKHHKIVPNKNILASCLKNGEKTDKINLKDTERIYQQEGKRGAHYGSKENGEDGENNGNQQYTGRKALFLTGIRKRMM